MNKQQLLDQSRSMRGGTFLFEGCVFSRQKRLKPFTSLVFDVRKSDLTFRDFHNPHKRCMAIELLIMHPGCNQRRWTKPFPLSSKSAQQAQDEAQILITDPGDEQETIKHEEKLPTRGCFG